MCIQNLSPYAKSKVFQKHRDNKDMRNILKYMEEDGSDLTQEFIDETIKVDSIRNENFKSVFPEWGEIIYASL